MYNRDDEELVYIFPLAWLLYPLILVVLLFGVFSYGILYPVCEFIKANYPVFSALLVIGLAYMGYTVTKKRKKVKLGVGAALSVGQFIVLIVLLMFNIVSISNPNNVEVFSLMSSVIVALLSFAYASFNWKMVVSAFKESYANTNTLIIVGVIGLIIDILLYLFI